MTLSFTTQAIDPSLNLRHNDKQILSTDQPINKLLSTHFNLFCCSIHNCICKRSKTGLILYPRDSQLQNVILLVCERCYNYQLENETQHNQLEEWYFNIYKDLQSFACIAKFVQNEDESFYFCNTVFNTSGSLTMKQRLLENWETELVEQAVRKNIHTMRLKLSCTQ